ncbi:MAG TPA: succinylglutamate desuccinylase/aspartoacylase family protein [Burkholderiaceae bacterium]|nr:succinylglutamate desuccinylase/aspartoacylase family protein [Burkholderiaceae bacterium]
MDIELLPRDLSPYRRGNTGVDYVHRFDSGRPGPHVLVNALTHGNEFCGMVACTHLLDAQVRPRMGTLTVSFANVAAYESFDPERPLDSRQLVHNLNRIWSSAWLDGPEHSPELARARELRAVVAEADHVLDLHSTSTDVQPFWVYPNRPANASVALAIGRPAVHLVMPQGLGSGTPLVEHGRLADAQHAGAGLVAECGGHFRRASGELATEVALDFIAHFGLIEREPLAAPVAPQRYELLRAVVIQSQDWRFARPVIGFEDFAPEELIATDGELEIRAPDGGCTILMPTRKPVVGREGVYLTRAC